MSYDSIASSTATTSNLNYPGYPGSSISSRIDSRYEHDWHRVGLIAGRTYQFDVTGRYGINGGYQNGGVDPTLRLRNSSGSQLRYNDDGGYGTNSRITFTAPTTGTYYLDVGGYGSGTGNYTLSTTDTSPGYLGPALYPTTYPVIYPGLWPDRADEVTQEVNVDDGVAIVVGGNAPGGIEVDTSETYIDNSITNVNTDNSTTYNITIGNYVGGSVNTTQTTNTTNIDVDIRLNGTEGEDLITGVMGQIRREMLDGGDGDDILRGYGGGDFLTGGNGNDFMGGNFGRDTLVGGAGNDEMNGGQGGDDMSGGAGADIIRGGAGRNTINAGAGDRAADRIYVHSDTELYGRPSDGSFADLLEGLGAEDQVYIHGVRDSQLSFQMASLGGEQGVGIFANGALEAVVTGGFGVDQVDAMTQGGLI